MLLTAVVTLGSFRTDGVVDATEDSGTLSRRLDVFLDGKLNFQFFDILCYFDCCSYENPSMQKNAQASPAGFLKETLRSGCGEVHERSGSKEEHEDGKEFAQAVRGLQVVRVLLGFDGVSDVGDFDFKSDGLKVLDEVDAYFRNSPVGDLEVPVMPRDVKDALCNNGGVRSDTHIRWELIVWLPEFQVDTGSHFVGRRQHQDLDGDILYAFLTRRNDVRLKLFVQWGVVLHVFFSFTPEFV